MRGAGRGVAVAGFLVAAVLAVRWSMAPVVPRPAGAETLVVSGETAGGAGPRDGFLLLHAEEVVLADGAGGGDASGAPGRRVPSQRPASGDPPEAVRLPAGGRVRPGAVVLVYEALALDRPVLRRVLVLDRLPAAVGGTRHLRRLVGAAGAAGREAGPAAGPAGRGHGGGLRVLDVGADGTVTLELAGRRVELAPGQGWGLGWAEGRGVRELPTDAAGWRSAVREARRRGEVVTSFSVVNRGWRRVRVPEG